MDSEVLFHSRTMVGLLIDLSRSMDATRRGVDTLPERLAPLLRRAPSRRASWLKENTDFLRAALPYTLILTGLVLYLKEPRAFWDILALARSIALP